MKRNRLINFFLILLTALIFLLGVFCYLESNRKAKVLEEKVSLIKDLVLNKDIIYSVVNSNEKHKEIVLQEVDSLDQEWVSNRKAGTRNILIGEFMSGLAYDRLKDFQKNHPEFKEIFVSDKYGLNVAGTNVTSDYYQADEAWWQRAYGKEQGETFVIKDEYDESVEDEFVGIYFPIVYNSSHSAIGVIKALLDSKY